MTVWDQAQKLDSAKGSVWDAALALEERPDVQEDPNEAYQTGKDIMDWSVEFGLPLDDIENNYQEIVSVENAVFDPSEPPLIQQPFEFSPEQPFDIKIDKGRAQASMKVREQKVKSITDFLALEGDKFSEKQKLSFLPDADLQYAADVIMTNPMSFDRKLHKAAERELRVRQFIGALKSAPDAKQTEMIVLVRAANLFNLSRFMSRLGMNIFEGGVGGRKGDMDAAIEAATRVLAEKNEIDPINTTRIVDLGAGVMKTAIEFWLTPGAQLANAPKAIRPMLQASAKFALREAIQAPAEGETLLQRAGSVTESGLLGLGVGAAGKFIPRTAVRVPVVVGGFAGLTYAKTGDIEASIETGVTVLGFEALGLMQKATRYTSVKLRNTFADKAVRAARAHNPDLFRFSNKEVGQILQKQMENWQQIGMERVVGDKAMRQEADNALRLKRQGDPTAWNALMKKHGFGQAVGVKPPPEAKAPPAVVAPVAKPLAAVAKPGVKPAKAQEAVPVTSEQRLMNRIDKAFAEKDIATLQAIVDEEGGTGLIGGRTKQLITAIKAEEHGLSFDEVIKLQELGHSETEILKMDVNKAKEILASQPPTEAKPTVTGEAEGGIRADTIQKQTGIKLHPGTARRVFDESKTIEQRRQLIKDADFEGLITNPERLRGEKVLDILAQPPTEAKPPPPEVKAALADLEIERIATAVAVEEKRISEIPREELPVSPRPLVDPTAGAKELGKQIQARRKWDKKHPGGKTDITPLADAHNLFMSIIEPSKAVEIAQGKDVYAEVIKAVHKADVGMIDFNEKELENLDSTLGEWGKALSKYSNRTLELLMLSRGKPASKSAILIRDEALEELAKKAPELVGTRKMITRASDFNYDYLAEVVGDQINYIEDYFYGIYKDPRKVEKFLDHWKTTKRFTKEKKLPTVADAKAFGLDLRDPNPVNNLRSEYLAIARLEGMIDLKASLMKSGEGDYIANTAEAPIEWDKVHDPVFADVRVAPELAKMINNLISTNKITRIPALNTLRQVNNFLRTIKFVGSAFHLAVEAKQSMADSGYLGFLHKATTTRGLTRGFRQGDPLFKTPEYKDYIAHGGGHRFSIDSEAQRAFTAAIEKMGKAGGIAKGVALPFALPEKFVRWMFENYIPKVKYSKYLDTSREQEVKLKRSLTSAEKIDIIKEQQNFYGMMNERLFGRSGTVTTLLRMKFMAPGFAEGNFRSMLKAVLQWGGNEGFSAHRSRANIINSFIISAIAATVGTLILTGKPPKKPEKLADIRDIFKIDTGQVDQHGRPIMIDMLTYDKDYWDVFGNIITGQPAEAVEATVRRLGGMTATTWDVLTDLNQMSMGRAVYDWKGDRVVEVTDPFLQRILKISIHELKKAEPISTNVFQQARKKGVGVALSAAMTLAGVRLTKTEQDKKEIEILHKIFSLRDQQETLFWYLGTIKNPREHIKKFNQTVMRILDNPITPLEVKDEYEPKLIIDEKRLTANKVYTFLGDQARLSEFSRSPEKHKKEIKDLQDDVQRASKWLHNFEITEHQYKKHLVDYEELHRKITQEIQPEDDLDDLKRDIALFYANQTLVKRKIQAGLGTDKDRRLAKKYSLISNNIAEVARRIYDTEDEAKRDSLFERIETVINRTKE